MVNSWLGVYLTSCNFTENKELRASHLEVLLSASPYPLWAWRVAGSPVPKWGPAPLFPGALTSSFKQSFQSFQCCCFTRWALLLENSTVAWGNLPEEDVNAFGLFLHPWPDSQPSRLSNIQSLLVSHTSVWLTINYLGSARQYLLPQIFSICKFSSPSGHY